MPVTFTKMLASLFLKECCLFFTLVSKLLLKIMPVDVVKHRSQTLGVGLVEDMIFSLCDKQLSAFMKNDELCRVKVWDRRIKIVSC